MWGIFEKDFKPALLLQEISFHLDSRFRGKSFKKLFLFDVDLLGTMGKGLKVFAEKYHPPYRVVLSAKNFSQDKAKGILHVPLYLAARLPKLMEIRGRQK